MVNGRLKERPVAHKFLNAAEGCRACSLGGEEKPQDKKFNFLKEYKDKTYIFMIMP
jgi:hypothetical protein